MKRFILSCLILLFCCSLASAQRPVPIVGGVVTANVFDSNSFSVALTGNVTGVTLVSTSGTSNAAVTPDTGYIVTMKFVQDSVGSRTVAFGGNITTSCAVNATANSVTFCRWQYTASGNTWADAGSSSGGGGSWSTSIDATSYGVTGNGHVCMDGTVASGSPNISSAGGCTWTSADIGSFVFVTSICGGSSCGFGPITASTTILPSTQIKIARIASITDSHHIVADCNAPANCVSPNASASLAGAATVVYAPTKQATQLNAAWAAGFGSGGCPTILLPHGIIFFETGIFNTLPAIDTCTPATGFLGIQQALILNGGGPVITGVGEDSTILVPTPDFNFSTGCLHFICIGPSSGSNNAVVYKDFTITGFGQSFHLSGITESGLVACTVCTMDHVILSGWMNGVGGTPGVISTSGFSSIHHSQIQGFGGQSGCLLLQGDNNFLMDSVVGFCNGPMLSAAGGTGLLNSTGNSFYVGNLSNTPQIDLTGFTIFNSTNDRIFGVGQSTNTSASDDIKIANGVVATIVNFYNQNTNSFDNGLHVFSGGTLILGGYNSRTGKNKGLTVDSGGTFFDMGGNTANYGSTTNSCAGTCNYMRSTPAITSAATNFGSTLSAQTITGFAPTGPITINVNLVQSLLGVSCTVASNTVTPTLAWTGPGGTSETLGLTALSISGVGVLDSFQNDTVTISAKAGTAITYTTTSSLASTGCSPIPQYTIYASGIQ